MPLTATNLKYKGAFKVSPGSNWQQQLVLNYGGHALAYNPANDSLFIAGHDWTQCIGEITIPVPKTSAYNTASFIQEPRIIPVQSDAQGDNVKWGGLYVENGNLYGTRYVYYDASLQATRSHGKLNGTNLNQTMQGLYTITSPNPGWVAGYIQPIPVSERSKFGGKTHFTGMGNLAILSRASNGPAAFAFNLADLGVNNPVASVPMVGYDVDHPLGGSISNAIYNAADSIRGAVFPDGSDTVLFFGVHGKGSYCYGTGAECNDPNDGSKGVHAYPYVPFVWAYRVSDLADVAAGIKQMHQILPYATWELTNFKGMPRYSGGVAYDPATRRLFISEMYADVEALPMIHVYEIDLGTPPPPDTTAPVISNVSVNATENSAQVSWTTNEPADSTLIVDGAGPVDVNLVTTHSLTRFGLNPNTAYDFVIESKDAAGNLASYMGLFTTDSLPPPDTTAPSVLSHSVSNITDTGAIITWSTDENSISKVTVNGVVYQDVSYKTSHQRILTGLSPNTNYSYVIETLDTAGNVGGGVGGSFTTLAAPVEPSGLLSRWSFSETSGSYTYDHLNRRGTLSGATRVAGKSGNGLNFDGINDRVNIADGNYLDFTNNFTVAAWVYPRANTGWRTVVLKERSGGLCYALYASDDNGKPNAYINIGGADVGVAGPNSLPINQWSHLAFTYGGGSFKLYINGVLVRTLSVSGNVTTSSSAFRFGGNAVWSEWLNGLIDEVRLYNRVLSAAEIGQIMNL